MDEYESDNERMEIKTEELYKIGNTIWIYFPFKESNLFYRIYKNIYRYFYILKFWIYPLPLPKTGTLSYEIMHAKPGDTIYLKNGIYTENISLKEDVTLQAIENPELLSDPRRPWKS